MGRTVYTCALNDRGGVEIDLTVTPVEAGIGELHDPIFKGRGKRQSRLMKLFLFDSLGFSDSTKKLFKLGNFVLFWKLLACSINKPMRRKVRESFH